MGLNKLEINKNINDIRLSNTPYDRRRKLKVPQQAIKDLYFANKLSISEIAKSHNVSRRTIQFILFPDRQIRNLKCRQARGGSKRYYKTKYNTQCIKEHKQYKAMLVKLNKI